MDVTFAGSVTGNSSSTMSGQGRFVTVTRKIASSGWFVHSYPLVFLVGVVGNCLAVIVLRRKAMRTSCSSVYLVVLAVADTAVLCLSGFKTWLKLATGFELLHTGDGSCRLILYGFYSATHVSAWLIVLVTAERLIVVHWPLKAGHTWLVRRPGLTVSILVFVILAVNSNILYTAELAYYVITPKSSSALLNSTGGKLDRHFDSNLTSIFERRNVTLKYLFCSAKKDTLIANINLFIYSLLPSVLLFSFNVAIIRTTKLVTSLFSTHVHTVHDKMCSSDLRATAEAAKRKTPSDQDPNVPRDAYAGNAEARSTPAKSTHAKPLLSSRHGSPIVPANASLNFRKHVTVSRQGVVKECSQQRLTVTLLALSFCWLLLSFPYSLIDSDVVIFKVEAKSRLVCFFLMYVNHAVNFYLYCFLRQKFRVELRRCLAGRLRFETGKRLREACPSLCIAETKEAPGGRNEVDPKRIPSFGVELVMDAKGRAVAKAIHLSERQVVRERDFDGFEFLERCRDRDRRRRRRERGIGLRGNDIPKEEEEEEEASAKRSAKCPKARQGDDERYN